jgi:tricorn protease
MCTRKLAAVLVTALVTTVSATAEQALWLRYPAISPDGETVVFSYRGDLWRVPSSGGLATPITLHEALETSPVWSPDGRLIAFASDRYGNLDVFVMDAGGGPATRLTYHSANDIPYSFTPDGAAILFGAGRLDAHTHVGFPVRGAQPELYRVATTGGMPEQVLTTPAIYAAYDRDAGRLAYSDEKGYESEWRKHDTSSFARDLWLWEIASNRHTRLTASGADDRQPVWSPDEQSLYFLSERSGTFNVWRLDLDDPSRPVQVTFHDTHPVRFLSISHSGDLCYAWDGQLWVLRAGAAESGKLDVEVAADRRETAPRWADVSGEITEVALSPKGNEIAFVARGEVFVTSTDHATTRRITDTPEQERSVSFSPDGRSLLYAGERGGSWNLYRTDLEDDEEPAFFNATALVERAVLETDAEAFQPQFSPDGKQIAFLEDRTTLRVLDVASGAVRTVVPGTWNYSYADGDQWFEWSPDGQWFLVEILSPGRWSTEVALVSAKGDSEPVNLTRNGYEDARPRWALGGEAFYWASDRRGLRQQAGWGGEYDIYAGFLTTKAWKRFGLSEAELEQVKKAEEKAKGKKEKDDEDKDKEEELKPELADPVTIELAGLEDRMPRLSLHSAALAGFRLSPDGETLVYLARFEKGFDLWKYVPRKKEVKLVAKLCADDADLELDHEGKTAFVLADRKLLKIDLEKGEAKPVELSAMMRLDRAAERAYFFEHAWRQTREKFYVEDMNGVDWDAMRSAYARFLPHIETDWDFAELVSELQGELNASHLGCGFRPRRAGAVETATLGFFPDPAYSGPGVRIAEVVEGGPLQQAPTRIAAGVIIEAIDGETIGGGASWYPLLDHKAGTAVRLSLVDKTGKNHWEETVKPITLRDEDPLLYERWVRSRRAEVDRLSGGRLGYAHVRSMDDPHYREIFEDIFGLAVGKEGIVLDTRFNNGGNLVEALTVFLSGKVYARAVPRGREIGVEPGMRWTKPSIVVMNEGNYSDAHCFPAAYTALGLGQTVGMQVPGTCTSVWWEMLHDRSLYFGIPMVGYLDNDGRLLENQHLDPDHEVDNDPALEAQGRDQQLETAVTVLLTEIDGREAYRSSP